MTQCTQQLPKVTRCGSAQIAALIAILFSRLSNQSTRVPAGVFFVKVAASTLQLGTPPDEADIERLRPNVIAVVYRQPVGALTASQR
jgi:hypothetical protein